MTRYTVSHKEGQGVKPHANEEGSLVEARCTAWNSLAP
jgi:hypothetical protein